MAATRSSLRRSVLAPIVVLTTGALLGACGGSSSETSAGEFFGELNGSAHVNYVEHRSLKAAATAADLVVLGRVMKVTEGPYLGPRYRGGIPTARVTAFVDSVVTGQPTGPTVDFLVIRGADFDVTQLNKRRPTEAVMLLLSRRADGKFELGGPQGLLVDSASGQVRAPNAEVENTYTKDVKRHRSLAAAAAAIRGS